MPERGGAGMRRHLRAVALAAALWAGGWQEVCGQRDDSGTRNDRVLFSIASVSTLKEEIGAQAPDVPYSNDTRLPNATVIKVLDTDTNPTPTGQALAPWHGPVMEARSRIGVGQQTIDEAGQRIFTLHRNDDGQSTLESVDLITGGERHSTTIPFFPATGLGYYAQAGYDGLIVTVRQRCSGDLRWCRARDGVLEGCAAADQSNSALEMSCAGVIPSDPPSYGNTYADACAAVNGCVHSPGTAPIEDHGLSAVAFHPTTGDIAAEVDLPDDVTRVQSGLSAMDESEGNFYIAVLRTDSPPAVFPIQATSRGTMNCARHRHR